MVKARRSSGIREAIRMERMTNEMCYDKKMIKLKQRDQNKSWQVRCSKSTEDQLAYKQANEAL